MLQEIYLKLDNLVKDQAIAGQANAFLTCIYVPMEQEGLRVKAIQTAIALIFVRLQEFVIKQVIKEYIKFFLDILIL